MYFTVRVLVSRLDLEQGQPNSSSLKWLCVWPTLLICLTKLEKGGAIVRYAPPAIIVIILAHYKAVLNRCMDMIQFKKLGLETCDILSNMGRLLGPLYTL